MKERRKRATDRRKSMQEIFEEHSKSDQENFKNINTSLENIAKHIERSNSFMDNLSWLSDISRGTELLKKPSLWILAFVIGVIAIMGGLKTIIAGIINWVGISK